MSRANTCSSALFRGSRHWSTMATLQPLPVPVGIGSTVTLGATGRDGMGNPFPRTRYQSSNSTIATVTPLGGVVTGVSPGSAKISVRGFNRDGTALIAMPADPTAGGGATVVYYDPFNITGVASDLNPGTRPSPKRTIFGSASGAPANGAAADTFPSSGNKVVIMGSGTLYCATSTGFVGKAGVFYESDTLNGGAIIFRCGVDLGLLTWTSLGSGKWSAPIPTTARTTYDMVYDAYNQQIGDAGAPTTGGHFFNNSSGTLTWQTVNGLTPAGRANCWFTSGNWGCAKLSNGTVFSSLNFEAGKDMITIASSATGTLFNCTARYAIRRFVSQTTTNSTLTIKGFVGDYCGLGVDPFFDYDAGANGSWFTTAFDNGSFAVFTGNANGQSLTLCDFHISHFLSNGVSHQPTTAGSGTSNVMYGLIEYGGRSGIVPGSGAGNVATGPSVYNITEVEIRFTCRDGTDEAGVHSFSTNVHCDDCWFHDNGALGGSRGDGEPSVNPGGDTTGLLHGAGSRHDGNVAWGNGHQFDYGSHNCTVRFCRSNNNLLGGFSHITANNATYEHCFATANKYGIDNRGAQSGVHAHGVTVRNCILMGNTSNNLSITRTDTTGGTITIDGNRYGVSLGTDVKFLCDPTGNAGGSTTNNAATIQGAGFEANGVFAAITYADPTFFLPQSSDAAIHAAIVLAGINDVAVSGSGPDIGWVEFGQVQVIPITVS